MVAIKVGYGLEYDGYTFVLIAWKWNEMCNTIHTNAVVLIRLMYPLL